MTNGKRNNGRENNTDIFFLFCLFYLPLFSLNLTLQLICTEYFFYFLSASHIYLISSILPTIFYGRRLKRRSRFSVFAVFSHFSLRLEVRRTLRSHSFTAIISWRPLEREEEIHKGEEYE